MTKRILYSEHSLPLRKGEIPYRVEVTLTKYQNDNDISDYVLIFEAEVLGVNFADGQAPYVVESSRIVLPRDMHGLPTPTPAIRFAVERFDKLYATYCGGGE